MRKKFKHIIVILLVITLLFSANPIVFAEETGDTYKYKTLISEKSIEILSTDDSQYAKDTNTDNMGFLVALTSVFSVPKNTAYNALDFLFPIIKDSTKGVKSETEIPDFPYQLASSQLVNPNAPMVALTFDDGPYSPVTDRIVAKLQEYNSRATFFVVGNRVSSYSNSVINAKAAGNEIANHTWDHSTLTKLTAVKIQQQMHDTDNAVQYYTGAATSLMRPVGGSHNATVDAAVGKPIIMWSVDTLDWKNRNATTVANKILNNVKDGDIILMHDLYKSTADACDIVIPALVARGYQLVTVKELAVARSVTLQNGVAYCAFLHNE